jgi:hypothetical protein
MTRILRRRPSPAMVVALLALFLSLGGVSWGVATGFIDSREIQNETIRSQDIRNSTIRTQDLRNNEIRGFDIRNSTVRGVDVALNTLTGADVDESKLDEVPSAAKADKATSADDVGGVSATKIAFTQPAGTAFVSFLDVGGLKLEAECAAGSLLTIRAVGMENDSALFERVGVTGGDSSFDVGDLLTVALPADTASPGISGDLVFRGSGGKTVSVELYALGATDSLPGTTTDDCGVWGQALVG